LLTSRTWQQSSIPSAESLVADPDNQLLSHANVRRLEAESIRDQLLAVSGVLRRDLFGPPVSGDAPRRSVYVRVIRNNLDPFLRTFDFPEPFTAVGRRSETNVPAQSLTLLNDRRVRELARQWAETILANRELRDDGDRVELMYRAAFSRKSAQEERDSAVRFLADAQQRRQEEREQRIRLEQRREEVRGELLSLMQRARTRLNPDNEAPPPAVLPDSLVGHWTFDDLSDQTGNADLTLHGGARIDSGALLLESGQAWAGTSPLSMNLDQKSLEVWVQLTDLQQRGGGAMSVQSLNGARFDAIVFGEKDPGQWLAGSNTFARTQSFRGPREQDAVQRPVHVVLTYANDGTITGYRDGVLYGKQYRSSGPQRFDAGNSVLTFGLRHLPATGNRFLKGRLLEARIYDRSLTPDQVRKSFASVGDVVSEEELLKQLTATESRKREALVAEIGRVEEELSALPAGEESDVRQAAWTDLAAAMFCFKEFIYLK